MVRNLWEIWVVFFYSSFFNIIKVKYFCNVLSYYYIYVLFCYMLDLVLYAFVSIKSNCILLSSIELKAILFIQLKHNAFHFKIYIVFNLSVFSETICLHKTQFYFFSKFRFHTVPPKLNK